MLADDAYDLLVGFRNAFGLDETVQFGKGLVVVQQSVSVGQSDSVDILRNVVRFAAVVVRIPIVCVLRGTSVLCLSKIRKQRLFHFSE